MRRVNLTMAVTEESTTLPGRFAPAPMRPTPRAGRERPTRGRRDLCGALVVAILLGSGIPARGALTTSACVAKKFKVWAALRKCQAGETAKALVGKPADLGKCQTKFQAALPKITAAAAKAGIACRYQDNGDGTVIDYDTGLQWEKKTAGACSSAPQLCVADADCPGGTCTPTAHYVRDQVPWRDAMAYAGASTSEDGATTSQAFLGNYTDWRLPTVGELETILDLSQSGCPTLETATPGTACIDPIFGPSFYGYYWTASSRNDQDAWTILFVKGYPGGNTFIFPKTTLLNVRAVRSAL